MKAPIEWTNIKVKLGDLKPWADNPRFSTKAQAARILKSFDKFGQVVTVAVSPTLEVYDGHQRLSALLTIHGAEFEIDARQSSRPLTDAERRELVISLHTGATGAWDWDKLSGWQADELQKFGMDAEALKGWNNDANNLKELLRAEVTIEDTEAEIDRAEELRVKWGVERGQLWQLGEHRLLCGDCTVEDDVKRVMGGEKATIIFTDPPYGVSIGAKNRFLNSITGSNSNTKDIESDDLDADDLREMLISCFVLAKKQCADDASVFVCAPQVGSLGLMMMMMMMRDAGLEVRHIINWVKNSATFSVGRLDYDYQHEPIMFTWIKTHKRNKKGAFQTSVWTVDKPRANKEHPTMKPVELPINAILNHTDEGDICYEPFSGSGTDLIACEMTNRKCRAIEISPAYVAVALERWAKHTGKTPVLID